MTILLVDDQPSILSALTTGIPWHDMGFTSVLTAVSAARARKILTEHPVDIVVSDIEMPGEDGLSLLAWARRSGMEYECILLTSHADFFYAKQAINLKVFDYIIQPARFEDIIASVKRAIEKVRRDQRQKAKASLDKANSAARNIVVKTLFEEWPGVETSVVYPQELEKRLSQLRHFGFEVSEESPCTVLSVYYKEKPSAREPGERFLAECGSFFEKLLQTHTASGLSCWLDDGHFLALLLAPLSEALTESLTGFYMEFFGGSDDRARMICAGTELRFLKNAVENLTEREKAGGGDERVRSMKIDEDALLESAMGQDRYLYYMRLLRNYIREHMSDPITRQDIARDLHLSADHISFIVKTTENMTVKKLINSVKMEHARNLLRSTRMSVGEVSQRCGYDSFAYFSKVYRETFNVTPSQDREKNEK